MKYNLIFLLSIIFIGCHKNEQLETTTITVKSVVCGMCAKNIEKAVYAIEGVKGVDVDIEKKIAQIKFVPLQTNIETIETTIANAGYDANDRKRDAGAYEELAQCCKIDG
ncbi:MAG TPA: heavy-metal-associated domain-containing protein [Bacteroidota bacterium]|nr:heavy-metal-associated domain-containing protein [Bacteroidota bacterium]